jgi:hypothetical protein
MKQGKIRNQITKGEGNDSVQRVIMLKLEDVLLLGIGFAFLTGIILFIRISSSIFDETEPKSWVKEKRGNFRPIKTQRATRRETPEAEASNPHQEFEEAFNKLGEVFEENRRKQGQAFEEMKGNFQERFNRAQENF